MVMNAYYKTEAPVVDWRKYKLQPVSYDTEPEPTKEVYQEYQRIFDIFNTELFDGKLPKVVMSMQRREGVMGYFSPNRFVNKENEKLHEIALNISYFAKKNIIEIFQTLVHEMAHLWQHEFGTSSRTGYHNKEWANKMESMGLMPSSTGKKGGNKTGQKMSDYSVEGGKFEEVSLKIIKAKQHITWFEVNSLGDYLFNIDEILANLESGLTDALYTPMVSLEGEALLVANRVEKKKNKTKYSCSCGYSLWGKPDLDIRCNDCLEDFEEVE